MLLRLTFALLLGGLAACQHTPPAPPNPQLQMKQVRDSYFLHPYDPSTVDAYARQLEAGGDTATALLLYERAVRFAPDRQDLLQRRDAAAQRLTGTPVTPPEASPSPAPAAPAPPPRPRPRPCPRGAAAHAHAPRPPPPHHRPHRSRCFAARAVAGGRGAVSRHSDCIFGGVIFL